MKNKEKILIDELKNLGAERADLLEELDRSTALQSLVPDVFGGGGVAKAQWSNSGTDERGKARWPKAWSLKVTRANGSILNINMSDEMPIPTDRLELFERVSGEIEHYKKRGI